MPAPSIFAARSAGRPASRARPAAVPPRFRPALARGAADPGGAVSTCGTPASPAAASDPAAALPRHRAGAAICAGDLSDWTPAPRPAQQRRRRPRLRRRGRARRHAPRCASATSQHGRRPDVGHRVPRAATASATARAGNVGADAIAHVVDRPMPASSRCATRCRPRGGVEPETMEEVRQRAPQAFRTQERAVTPERLRRGRAAPPGRPARRGDPPLDRAAGTPSSSPSTASAARPVDADFERDAASPSSSASAWPATTSRSTARASCR